MRIHHVTDAGYGDHWQPGGALGMYREDFVVNADLMINRIVNVHSTLVSNGFIVVDGLAERNAS